MAKRPQSGDAGIHNCCIFTCTSVPAAARRPFFAALCPDPYRKWPNGRRVATSTSTSTAYLQPFLRRHWPGGQILTKKTLVFYRKFANGRRVATSTSTLTAFLRAAVDGDLQWGRGGTLPQGGPARGHQGSPRRPDRQAQAARPRQAHRGSSRAGGGSRVTLAQF